MYDFFFRPFIDVRDLIRKGLQPDKRSIITYITQFLRHVEHCTLKGKIQKKQQTIDLKLIKRLECYRPLIEWLNEIVIDNERMNKETEIDQQKIILKYRVKRGFKIFEFFPFFLHSIQGI